MLILETYQQHYQTAPADLFQLSSGLVMHTIGRMQLSTTMPPVAQCPQLH